MSRVTIKEVQSATEYLKQAMRKAGIQREVTNGGWTGQPIVSATLTADDVRVEAGSQTYGRAWRIYYVDPFGAHYDMHWSDYLGWTGAEALHTVRALTSGINAALEAASA